MLIIYVWVTSVYINFGPFVINLRGMFGCEIVGFSL